MELRFQRSMISAYKQTSAIRPPSGTDTSEANVPRIKKSQVILCHLGRRPSLRTGMSAYRKNQIIYKVFSKVHLVSTTDNTIQILSLHQINLLFFFLLLLLHIGVAT